VGGFGSRGVRRGAGFALVIAALAAVAFAAPAQANVDYFGVNTAQAIRTGTVTPSVFYDRLAGMGGNVLREDVNWDQVEPQNNNWQWGYLDNEINSAPAGVGVILMFLNSPGWVRDPVENLAACQGQSASTCRMPPATTKLNEWQDLIRTTVSRYRSRVVAVEVWNEPNLKSFWRPGGNEPARWAGLIQTASQAVADVDPAIPVISGGLGSGPTSDSNVAMQQGPYLDAAYASLPSLPQYVDGIGIHPYAQQLAPDAPGNGFSGTLSAIRQVLAARDPGKPMWATETGYYTRGQYAVTEAQQRDWLLQIYDQLAAAPDVKAMIIHTLFEATWQAGGLLNPNAQAVSYGIVNPVGNLPKPAWTGFHNRFFP
jgi:hypothetical protein